MTTSVTKLAEFRRSHRSKAVSFRRSSSAAQRAICMRPHSQIDKIGVDVQGSLDHLERFGAFRSLENRFEEEMAELCIDLPIFVTHHLDDDAVTGI